MKKETTKETYLKFTKCLLMHLILLQTNNSSVETMIMVHENREILTHNSRRFLVICQFNPETYTFTASADVPSHLLKRKKLTQAGAGAATTASSTSASLVFGPTGTKPLVNSKEYLVDETSVPSFHEYPTSAVTSSLPYSSNIHHLPRDLALEASASPGTSSTTSSLSTTESRSNFFKLRLPLNSVTRSSNLHSK